MHYGRLPEERAGVRDEINSGVDETIASMVDTDPEFQKRFDASVGYFVSRFSATKIPIIGAGYGIGILYDKDNNSRTYMIFTRAEILGASLMEGRDTSLRMPSVR